MSELLEKDPRLARILDASKRDLLDDPHPIEIDTANNRAARFTLVVENGQEGLIDIEVSADQAWLQPQTRRLQLVGGEKGDCLVAVEPTGEGEFANLKLSWSGATESYSEYVLVWRRSTRPKPAPPPASPAGPQRVAPLPDWMK